MSTNAARVFPSASPARPSTTELATWPMPQAVVMDQTGNLYITDYLNNRIRMVSPDGIISTIAGTTAIGSISTISSCSTAVSI